MHGRCSSEQEASAVGAHSLMGERCCLKTASYFINNLIKSCKGEGPGCARDRDPKCRRACVLKGM